MGLYPQRVEQYSSDPKYAGGLEMANAAGTAANFVCGSFVRILLQIDDGEQRIQAAKFQTNGCGFLTAAAELISRFIKNRELKGLHGIDQAEMLIEIQTELGAFPEGRVQCAVVAVEALKNAFADYRRYRIEEFQGEKALICTCFAVSEETVARVIAESGAADVRTVSAICRAGSGCGSCRMLIQEMIDEANDEPMHDLELYN